MPNGRRKNIFTVSRWHNVVRRRPKTKSSCVVGSLGPERMNISPNRLYTEFILVLIRKIIKIYLINTEDPIVLNTRNRHFIVVWLYSLFFIYSKNYFLVLSSYHNLESDNGNTWNVYTNYIIILFKTHWCASFVPIILYNRLLWTRKMVM